MSMTAWVWRMAWRDSRGSRKRLLLAASAVTCGLAALVAITSFGANVREAVRNQSKVLLGADLLLSSRQPFAAETETEITAIGGEQSREVRCNSMAYFPTSGGTRLVQVRALAGGFPYYGALETNPPEAARTFSTGPNALVDDSLLYQFDARIGDTIKLGAFSFTIAGRLQKIPGEAGAASLIGPRVYIPLAYLARTALIQEGSMVSYRAYFKLTPETDPDQLLDSLQPYLNAHRMEGETVKKRAASVGKLMDNLSRFLHLTGLVALLLGGIGVASAIHVYISEKVATVAVLRCLGARTPQTFAIYAVQAITLGVGGSLLGAGIGVGVQQIFPRLLQDFLPIHIETAISWSALGQAVLVGFAIVLLFTALPLLAIRHVSPLQALRSAYEESRQLHRDPLRWLLLFLLILSIVTFVMLHTERWVHGLWVCAAIGGALLVLVGVAKSLMVLVRAAIPQSWPYVWRQGLANLHRPRNQTLILILALGFGAFLLLTLQFVQHTLMRQVSRGQDANQSNLILFDIQTDQRQAVLNLVRSFSLPITQEAPLVTMRLAVVKGKSVEELRNDPQQEIADWALQHEYRASYRQQLIDTETLIAGSWQGTRLNSADTPGISLEEEVARALRVTVGDELVFDVQGVPMSTIITSIRQVDWRQVKPNFFVVFPLGVLEAAPQTHLLMTRTPSSAVSAAVQRAVVQHFPNVSALDLTSVLDTFDTILGRIAFAIRFMALFSIAAGVLVLFTAVVTSRQQRVKESVLLRTLGASRKQIRQILVAEYLFLGGFAMVSGALLAVMAGWGLSHWLFEATFSFDVIPLLITLVVVVGLTVLTGALGNRGVINRPPLEVLRNEG